jgi:hypothetical protein
LRRQSRNSGLSFLGRHILVWRLILRLAAGVRRLLARLGAGLVLPLVSLHPWSHRNRRPVWLRHRNNLARVLHLDLPLGRYFRNRLDVHRLKIGCGNRRHDRVLADDYRTAIRLLNDSHRNLDCRSSGLDCRSHFPESWDRKWIHLWPGPCEHRGIDRQRDGRGNHARELICRHDRYSARHIIVHNGGNIHIPVYVDPRSNVLRLIVAVVVPGNVGVPGPQRDPADPVLLW